VRGLLQYVAEATFGVDPGAGYADLELVEGSLEVGVQRLMHDDPSYVQRSHGLPKLPGGTGVEPFPVEGEIKFTMRCHGRAKTIPQAAPASTTPIIDFCVAAFGARYGGGYRANGVSGGTPALVSCADLSSFRAGQLVAITDGQGAYSARFARHIDEQAAPDTLAPATGHAFGFAPVATTDLYGSICAMHADSFSADAKSYTFVFHWPSGASSPAAYRRTFVGCRPRSVSWKADNRGVPEWTFTWAVAGEMSIVPSTLPDLDYDYPEPSTFASVFCYLTDGVAGRELDPASITWEYDNDLKMDGNPNSPTGVAEWRKGNVTVKVTLDPYFDGEFWAHHFEQDELYLEVVTGFMAGRHYGWRLPSCRIAQREDADRDGLMADALTLERTLYSGDTHTDPAGDPVTSATVDAQFTAAWT
jgi:hypothetical protein